MGQGKKFLILIKPVGEEGIVHPQGNAVDQENGGLAAGCFNLLRPSPERLGQLGFIILPADTFGRGDIDSQKIFQRHLPFFGIVERQVLALRQVFVIDNDEIIRG